MTERWIEACTKSVIFMRPVIGGGAGFTVQLQTALPVGREQTREKGSDSIMSAGNEVRSLMELVRQHRPGAEWSKIQVENQE